MNFEVYSSFEGLSSDYRIVSVKICMSRCRNKKQTVKVSQYEWSSLDNNNIGNQYILIGRNKFDTLQETSEQHTSNEKYENLVTTHIEAAAKCIPTKKR